MDGLNTTLEQSKLTTVFVVRKNHAKSAKSHDRCDLIYIPDNNKKPILFICFHFCISVDKLRALYRIKTETSL